MRRRDRAERRTQSLRPLRRRMLVDFNDYADRVDEAVARAKRTEPTGRAHDQNPSTNVWQLIESITGGGG